MEDTSAPGQHIPAQQSSQVPPKADEDDDDDIPALEAPIDEGEIDETGVDPKDIELVMTQVRLSITS